MAEVRYCLGSKIKFFSGFNIVATYLFEDFCLKFLFYYYFDYKLLTNKNIQKVITQAADAIMNW